MTKLKVMSVVGTRPELIRLSRVLAALDASCDLTLVHTGQNFDYELNQVFFDELDIRKPDYVLDCAAGSGSAAHTIGSIIIAVDRLLAAVRPEAFLVLGDTNSCLSVIAAKRHKVPIFHMEAGNRCFDPRVPEETNRRIVDHTADIHLPYSGIAREYLLREGLPPDHIIKTGSPMFEVLQHYRPRIETSEIVQRLDLQPGRYFVVSAHREENVEADDNFARLVSVINMVAAEHGLPVIVSTHPRTQQRIAATGAKFHPNIRLLKPLGFLDYVRLQMSAKAVLSDSGTISEEASILGFPALNLREAHERPEAMEEAAVTMVGLSAERVRQGLSLLAAQPRGGGRLADDYSRPDVSEKIVRIIHSYTDYVNRVVWKKY
ncbi:MULTISPECIES: UDP-N-acetylglucosamine 2-epimerase (non-hydrolyzing) [Rhodomicrobium]|uniref:non-hydrolyzing UDP-N-acetylglucosamine 2-epimerase n=1 Tax=Rhodomicrobium TaxID=1068 RepID=UPI000B4A6E7B|nr:MULTISPECIES: UDP-N-acetylglucosamine 2-epimerase (non-hydrolyzing) [Rhodomicrobium]